MARRVANVLLFVAMLAGCAGTKENLKRHGIETEGTKVLRVFRF